MPDLDDQGLRAAARAWLAASDKLDKALAGDDTAATLELAEAATLARLRMQQALVALGWSPPNTVRSPQQSSSASS